MCRRPHSHCRNWSISRHPDVRVLCGCLLCHIIQEKYKKLSRILRRHHHHPIHRCHQNFLFSSFLVPQSIGERRGGRALFPPLFMGITKTDKKKSMLGLSLWHVFTTTCTVHLIWQFTNVKKVLFVIFCGCCPFCPHKIYPLFPPLFLLFVKAKRGGGKKVTKEEEKTFQSPTSGSSKRSGRRKEFSSPSFLPNRVTWKKKVLLRQNQSAVQKEGFLRNDTT